MKSSASTRALLALCAGLACAFAVPAHAELVPLPEALLGRVALRVAEAWRVESGAVHAYWRPEDAARAADHDSLRIAGTGEQGWLVLVLAAGVPGENAHRIRVAVDDSTFVATRGLAVGARIGSGDVRRERRAHWGPRFGDDVAAIDGWVVRRALVAGAPVVPPAVVPPPAISAGQPVRLTWQRGAVAVTVQGIALGSAPIGGQVSVRLADSRERRTAIVTELGEARLQGMEAR